MFFWNYLAFTKRFNGGNWYGFLFFVNPAFKASEVLGSIPVEALVWRSFKLLYLYVKWVQLCKFEHSFGSWIEQKTYLFFSVCGNCWVFHLSAILSATLLNSIIFLGLNKSTGNITFPSFVHSNDSKAHFMSLPGCSVSKWAKTDTTVESIQVISSY